MEEFQKLTDLLKQKNLKITAAESCTGGLFCASLVEIASVSAVFDRGFVTYSEESKCTLVGVPPKTIRDYGVVSEKTAAAMAKGAAAAAGADVGVGITGFAGPSGGDKFACVGTVCVAVWYRGHIKTFCNVYKNRERNAIRFDTVRFACKKTIEMLEE